jgi:uncharacterized OB-fold protein
MKLMTFEVKIKAIKCLNCGLLQHASHLRCLNCKSENFELIEVSGQCRLLTFTILTAVPKEFLEKKRYALGVVEFENGVRALGQISTQEDLKIGMRLRAVSSTIQMDGQQINTYCFEPIKNEY